LALAKDKGCSDGDELEAATVKRIVAELTALGCSISDSNAAQREIIRGNRKDGHPQQSALCGRPICDRRQWQRNPDIAQRERRYRAEWIESPVPDLRMNNDQRIAVL
jgi:ribonuclease HI